MPGRAARTPAPARVAAEAGGEGPSPRHERGGTPEPRPSVPETRIPARLRAMPRRRNLKDHSVERLREQLAEDGWRPYRAQQIAQWLYARGEESPSRCRSILIDTPSTSSAPT